MIIVPPRPVEAIDLVDEVIAAVQTIHVALNAPDMIDDDALRSLVVAHEDVLRKLIPIREMINEQHARS
ncbi:hypothetical protein NB311A_05118 [Nitrobacter sp. Nb-311A]|uniref:hypothetical protein n=1 Tax=Nitrobacter sp. Nb-311A TaxID=314253 RepID=UPI00006870A8|nr:hypothetical protein [Nitrobacter sp. Nb-311A]EAQ35770.1 hypothetical protein NB311A_05118 [Nitrobacter sp. Nb-311A]